MSEHNLIDLFTKVPELFYSLDVESLSKLVFLGKKFNEFIKIKGDTCGYWQACCCSVSKQHGLYIDEPRAFNGTRAFFFSDLWFARNKFDSTKGAIASFKVQVASRFRPGDRTTNGIVVPLRQFLKVRRQQKSLQDEKSSSGVLVGTEDPENFLDPLLGTIMKDPVMLSTSGRVVDRTVAVQYLIRGGRDPFSNKKMTNQSIIPQPELAAEIRDWREKKSDLEKENISLGSAEIKSLVDDQIVDPEIIAALMDIEQLDFVAKRAFRDAMESEFSDHTPGELGAAVAQDTLLGDNDGAALLEINPAVDIDHDVGADLAQNHAHKEFLSDAELDQSYVASEGEGNSNRRWYNPKDGAKVLDISSSNSCISMNVPGSGVRPFYFARVFEEKCKQQEVYERAARDLVGSCLNGFNSCLLCYGQVPIISPCLSLTHDSLIVSLSVTVSCHIYRSTTNNFTSLLMNNKKPLIS